MIPGAEAEPRDELIRLSSLNGVDPVRAPAEHVGTLKLRNCGTAGSFQRRNSTNLGCSANARALSLTHAKLLVLLLHWATAEAAARGRAYPTA